MNEQFREGDTILVPRSDFLSYNVIGVNQNLLENLESDTFDVLSSGEFDKPTKHSSIIGWAYDGNPIYGPFGYSDPNNISSNIVALKSSYVNDITKVENRPSGFDAGFFIDDYYLIILEIWIYIMEDFVRHQNFQTEFTLTLQLLMKIIMVKLLVNIHIL